MVVEDLDGTFVAPSADKADLSANVQNQQKLHEEHQYLNLIQQILSDGEHRPDRYFAHFS